MKKRILLVATSVVLAMSMLVTGCSTKTADKTGTAATTAPAAGGKIAINLGTEPPQMNSFLSTDSTSGDVQRIVFEGLTKLGKDGKVIPGIAEKWETSSDGLKWTFTLRDSKWSDGTPLTAEDFRYGIIQLLKKDNAAEYAYLGYYIKNGEEFNKGTAKEEDVGVKVLDPKKLEITLAKPAPFILDLMAFHVFLPVNKAFFEKQDGGKKYGAEAANMIYNGPYMIKEWKHDDSLTLVKNPNYWNAKDTKLDEIKMTMIKDSNTALNSFFAGDLDMVGLNGSAQVSQVESKGGKVTSFPDGACFYLEFNTKDKVLGNVNIRKALSAALDRGSFTKNVLKNKSLPATSFTDPTIYGEKESFAKEIGTLVKDNDTTAAKDFLAKGLKELNLTSVPKIEMIADDTDTAKRDSQAFQEMWKKNLGIDVTISNMPFKARLEKMKNKDFQIVIAGWSADYNDPVSFLDMFETGNGNNHSQYSNADYDKMLKSVQNNADAKKRMDTLKDMEKKLMDDMPVAPIYWRYRDYTTSDRLQGVVRQFNQDIDLSWAYVTK